MSRHRIVITAVHSDGAFPIKGSPKFAITAAVALNSSWASLQWLLLRMCGCRCHVSAVRPTAPHCISHVAAV